MRYSVWLRTDAAGPDVLIARDGHQRDEDSARWQLVAQTDDHGEAVGVAEMLSRKLAGEPIVWN